MVCRAGVCERVESLAAPVAVEVFTFMLAYDSACVSVSVSACLCLSVCVCTCLLTWLPACLPVYYFFFRWFMRQATTMGHCRDGNAQATTHLAAHHRARLVHLRQSGLKELQLHNRPHSFTLSLRPSHAPRSLASAAICGHPEQTSGCHRASFSHSGCFLAIAALSSVYT